MRAKLPYLILVAVGLVIMGARSVMGLPATGLHSTPSATPASSASSSTTSTPTPDPSGKGSMPSQTPGGNGTNLTMLDASSQISGQQAVNWSVGLANTAKFLRVAISGGQINTVTAFESGSKPYADIVSALQNAKSNNFQPVISSDIVIDTATLYDLTDEDKSLVSNWGQTPQAQGWLINYRQTMYLAYGPNQLLTIDQTWVEGGYLKNDPDLGPIWIDTFRMDCSGSGSRLSLCQEP